MQKYTGVPGASLFEPTDDTGHALGVILQVYKAFYTWIKKRKKKKAPNTFAVGDSRLCLACVSDDRTWRGCPSPLYEGLYHT